MRIAILLPSLKRKGPVILAFDLIKHLIDKVHKIDVFYFSECSDPYFLIGLENIKYTKLSFYKPFSFSDYDIVHSHSLKPDLYTFFFKSRIKCRIITTVHNYVYEELYYTYNILISKIFSWIWISTWSNKDSVVFLSNNMKKYYEEKNIGNNNTLVIYNGRNIAKEIYQNKKNEISDWISETKKHYTIIGCCGFLNKRKGFEDILNFLTLSSNLFAVFIGQGPDKNRLINLSKSLNVFERCIFLGNQNDSISLIALFDIFVMSSYSEGFPLVVLEAGGVSVPILCVNSPLFQELFSDKDVVFYEKNDFDSMTLGLNKIIKNHDVYSKNINKTINTRYSCNIMAENYLQLFTELNAN